jgi:hypothetical protein
MWFAKIGAIHGDRLRANIIIIVIGTLTLIFVKPFLFDKLSWWVYGILIILAGTLGTHRGELNQAIKHGTWWWKPKKNGKKKREG